MLDFVGDRRGDDDVAVVLVGEVGAEVVAVAFETEAETISLGALMLKDPGLLGDFGLTLPDKTKLIVCPGAAFTTGLGSMLAELRFLGESKFGEVGGVVMELKKAERAACL